MTTLAFSNMKGGVGKTSLSAALAVELAHAAVYTLRQARRKPLELAANVDKGFTRLLDADPGYGKLLAKNPLCEQWLRIIWHDKAWGLTELLDYISDRIRRWKPQPQETIGLLAGIA
jgi:hypothetical protein